MHLLLLLILSSHQVVRALFWLWPLFIFLFFYRLLTSFYICIWTTVVLFLFMIKNTFDLIGLLGPTLRCLLLNTLLNNLMKFICSYLIIILLKVKNTIKLASFICLWINARCRIWLFNLSLLPRFLAYNILFI